MKRQPCVSWINVNIAHHAITTAGHRLWFGAGGKCAATSLQVQSNENAQLTGAFNCIYAKAKSDECGGLLRMKASGRHWKIWFSLNIAFRLLIRCGRWDHHKNNTWADGFIWTRQRITWVWGLHRITWFRAKGFFKNGNSKYFSVTFPSWCSIPLWIQLFD